MQFCECLLQQHAANVLYKNILWIKKTCLIGEGIFNAYSCHLWAWVNLRVTLAHGYQIQFSVNMWVGSVRDILKDPRLLPHCLD
jgi:hypothetical protein